MLFRSYSNSDDSWVADKDQFGNPIETELNIFYKTEKQIIKHSKELVEDFLAEEAEEYADTERINEYDLGYITDFSKIFIFGVDGAGRRPRRPARP